MNQTILFHRLTFAALIVLSLGTFTSISLTAISHLLLILPGIYFLFRYKISSPPKIWALVAVWTSCFLSIIFNWSELEDPMANLLSSRYYLIGALSFLPVHYCFKEYLSTKKIRLLLNLSFISTALASLSGIIGLYTGFNPLKLSPACDAERACGLFEMLMTYAYGISLFMLCQFGLIYYRHQLTGYLNTRLALASLLINGVGLFLSYTRGAWLGLLLGIPFFFFKKDKKKFLISLVGGILILAIGIIAVPKVQSTFLERQGSDSQRIAFFKSTLKVAQERPIFGLGYKNFEPNSKRLKRKYNLDWQDHEGHAHNNLLEHLASTGLIGALAFLALSFLWIYSNYKRNDPIGKTLFPVSISFFISGMFQYTFGDGENLFLLMLLIVL